MRYSVQAKDQIFVKGYGFLSLAKNMGKNISKILSSKCSQKRLDHAKQATEDALKTSSKRVFQKLAESTCDLIDNKIADGITKVSKTLPQNNSETITNEHYKEIPKGRYVSPEERHEIIDDLRLI